MLHHLSYIKHLTSCLLHHTSHAWCTAHRHSGLLFGLVNDEALSGEEHASDTGSILQSHTGYLGRIDDTSLTQVLVFVETGIVTEVALALANLLYDDGTLFASIADNLTQRLLNSAADDVDTVCSSALSPFRLARASWARM